MRLSLELSVLFPIDPSSPTDQVRSINSGLFLIESSGRETLNARQACAVESAARQSGMEVHLLVTATQLDLRDNTTCYLYKTNKNIKFYSIDVMAFSLNSPLGKSNLKTHAKIGLL